MKVNQFMVTLKEPQEGLVVGQKYKVITFVGNSAYVVQAEDPTKTVIVPMDLVIPEDGADTRMPATRVLGR
jgi:hypothetical protein